MHLASACRLRTATDQVTFVGTNAKLLAAAAAEGIMFFNPET